MKNELKKISKKLAEIERIREETAKTISELPDNPRIQCISDNPSCFVMSSNILSSPQKNMSPFYYDFKQQYVTIAEVLRKRPVISTLQCLRHIVENGTLKNDYRRFHPDVIKHLSALLS